MPEEGGFMEVVHFWHLIIKHEIFPTMILNYTTACKNIDLHIINHTQMKNEKQKWQLFFFLLK